MEDVKIVESGKIEYGFTSQPEYEMNITESFTIVCDKKIPNLFHRTMMKLFFGWTFKKL